VDLFLFQKGIKHPDVEYTKTRGDDMLRKKDLTDRNQVTMVSLEELVPKDHLVRKIEAAMDFSFIYDLVEDLYSDDKGRPSIDPVVLIKICMIKYIFGIRLVCVSCHIQILLSLNKYRLVGSHRNPPTKAYLKTNRFIV
jgi:hypothetical protein